MPIVFILPGTGRNSQRLPGSVDEEFQEQGSYCLLLEFPQEYYSTSEYIEGNMFKKNEALPEEQWSFSRDRGHIQLREG